MEQLEYLCPLFQCEIQLCAFLIWVCIEMNVRWRRFFFFLSFFIRIHHFISNFWISNYQESNNYPTHKAIAAKERKNTSNRMKMCYKLNWSTECSDALQKSKRSSMNNTGALLSFLFCVGALRMLLFGEHQQQLSTQKRVLMFSIGGTKMNDIHNRESQNEPKDNDPWTNVTNERINEWIYIYIVHVEWDFFFPFGMNTKKWRKKRKYYLI